MTLTRKGHFYYGHKFLWPQVLFRGRPRAVPLDGPVGCSRDRSGAKSGTDRGQGVKDGLTNLSNTVVVAGCNPALSL